MDAPDAAYDDAALYGKDPTPGLVDVVAVRDAPDAAPATVRLYRRTPDGSLVAEDDRVYPFFFLSDDTLLDGLPKTYKLQPLGGDAFFRFVVVFNTWRHYYDALRHLDTATESRERRPDEVYRVGSPAQQYLMQTGRTLFKGMTLEDLHRLQFDLEVVSEGGFPSADRPNDAVVIVALSDNRGWSLLLHSKDHGDEARLLREALDAIRERDPDVLEGHNLYAFDLPYFETRCRRHGIPFALGRDGSTPRSFPAQMRFAERSIEYPAYEIAGRHIVDTLFQVMSYDVTKRDLPGYGLKVVAKYFGFAPEGRTYVDGDQIGETWRTDPDRLLAYALDDVIETERIARHLSGASFYLTQMLPMPYGQAARTGPAAKIEALFVREYLRQRQSVPKPEWGSQTVGGYTDVFATGVFGPIVYADVESLYPSIMLEFDVRPRSDTLGLFPSLLRRLRDLRIETKRAARVADTPDERSSLDARQASYKILINSFYGYLAFGFGSFNDFAEADRVAATGQELLRAVIRALVERGATVVEVDTDGVLFVPPPDLPHTAEAEEAFVVALNDVLPSGIRIAYEGRAAKMLSYKKKNYALLDDDGTIKFKGSSLVSRSIERFGRAFVAEAIRLLLDEDVGGLHRLYVTTRERILARDWKGVESFARTETLKDPVEQYRADVEAGKRSRAASYELAIQQAEETGLPVKVGDRVTYYVTGTTASVTTFENAHLARFWTPDAPDENTAYYLKRLDEFARKFDVFFTPEDFARVFAPPDLFGFDASAIRLVRRVQDPGNAVDEVPF